MAKAIALILHIPIIGCHHLKGHIYSLFIEKETHFPLTVLLVSGGHTQVIEAESLEKMHVVASTMDDSFGESFDKCAKMMKLGYPGGPIIEKMAEDGDEMRYKFTVPLVQSPKIAFSYSGLKNAVRLAVLDANESDYPDIAASFQRVAVEHLLQKLRKYFKIKVPQNFTIVGGASANLYLRSKVKAILKPYNANMYDVKLEYTSDNAAMIGRLAVDLFERQLVSDIDTLTVSARSAL